ncbi:hypothetical protein E2C01_037538 [Portunus trituberculatus]|uniref:Uncharacterized protein n=1 Tax=Portunus trituberculatus TaxID=210409 RepID=A0A5B7FHC7_PORTR|nr:hypothetical protein [Portunus trituberculatus]
MDHRVHTWRFEVKLGSPLAAAWRTTQLPESRADDGNLDGVRSARG